MDSVTIFAPDIRTVAYLIAAVNLLAAAVYLGLWLQGTGGRATAFWALGHGLGLIGFALISLRGVIPDLLSITVANPVILAAMLCLLKGLAIQMGRPFPDRAAWVLLAGTLLVFAYFTHFRPDIGIRTVLISGLGAGVLLAGALPLLRLPRGERNWVHIYLACAFLAVGAVQVLRLVWTLSEGYGAGLMSASAVHGLAIVVNLLGLVTWTLGFFWLIAQDLRRDLEEEVAVRREQERRLRESEKQFRAIFDNSVTGIAFTDREGNLLLANKAFAELVGYPVETLLNRNVTDITHPDDRKVTADRISHLLESGESHYRLEKRFLIRDGSTVWVDLTVAPVRGDGGEPLHLVVVANDIDERKALEAELEDQANRDSLTGAMNRRHFNDLLEREQERVNRYGSPASLIMLDLDHFKVVNDTHGHATGDWVLQEVTHRIQSRLRESDILARWGGEEFLIMLPETGVDGAKILAEALRQAVAEDLAPDCPSVRVSLGVTELQPGETVEEALKRADEALYEAKTGGRNRVHFR